MGNIWKRSLSMFLAMVMVFGMLPIQAFAEETGDHTHAYGEWSVTTPATAEAEGEESRTCDCGEVETRAIAKLEAHSHAYEEAVTAPTCVKGGYTTYTCACGDSYVENETAAPGHTWGEWTVTTPATVDAEGVESRTCAACGEVETRAVAKLEAHSHAYEEAVTAPTCVEGGYTTYTCACGDSYVANETAALGHTWGDWAVTTPATVDAEGVESRTCACGAEETRVIGKLAPTLSGETRKVYFLNVEDWAEVYAVWSFDEEYFDDPAFPGEVLEADGELENVWFVELPVEADAVCFNDGVAVTEELLAREAENQIEVIHAYDAVLDEELDYYDADRQEAGAEVTWLRYADLVAEKKAAGEAAAAVAEVQAMIDALPTSFATQEEVDNFWDVTTVALDAAIEALNEDQQAQLDTSNYDAAIDAAAAFTNPEFGNDATWEAVDGAYWNGSVLRIKVGTSLTTGDMYNLFYNLFGAYPADACTDNHQSIGYTYNCGAKEYRFGTDTMVLFREWGSSATQSGTGTVSLSEGTTYTVRRYNGHKWASIAYAAETEDKTFTVEYYYDVTLSCVDGEGNSFADGNVTYDGTKKHGDSFEVTKGASVAPNAIVINGETWTAASTITPMTNGTLTVTYTKSVATVTITGDYSKVKIGDLAATGEQQELAPDTYTITVTPNWANGEYVNDVKVGGESVIANGTFSSGVFTCSIELRNGDNITIDVKCAARTLQGTANAEVEYNPYLSTANQVTDVTAEILSAVEATANNENVATSGMAVQFYPWYEGSASGWKYADEHTVITASGFDVVFALDADVPDRTILNVGYTAANFAERWVKNKLLTGDCKEKVIITWAGNDQYPTITEVFEIKLVDGRIARTTSYQDSRGMSESNPIAYESKDELAALIKGSVTLSGLTWADTHTFTYSQLPTNNGKKQITVTMTGDTGDATYVPTTTFKVWVQAPEAVATINFDEGTGSNGSGSVDFGGLTTNGTLSGGIYTLTVTPSDLTGSDGSAMYVESVAINGTLLTDGTYDGGKYSVNYTVVADETYNVVITYGTRTLVLKDLSEGISLNGYASLTDVTARRASYQAALVPGAFVDYTNSTNVTENADIDVIMYIGFYPHEINIESLNAVTHGAAIDEPTVTKSFRIVCNADEKCVAVSVDNVSVQLNESRVAPTITLGNLSDTSFDTLEAAQDAFKKAIVVKDSAGDDITANAQVSVTWTEESTSTLPGTLKANVKVTNNGQTWVASTDATQLTTDVGINKYTVTWKDENGVVLETDENVDYGATPSYNGATPTKENSDNGQYSYTFADWTPEVAAVTGNATYTATYTATTRSYTVKWDTNGDGDTDVTKTVPWGTNPLLATDAPTALAKENQSFDKWTNAGNVAADGTITGNVTYTATYTNDTTHTVTIKDGNTNLHIFTVNETQNDTIAVAGKIITHQASDGTEKGSYTLEDGASNNLLFKGWLKDNAAYTQTGAVKITADMTLTADWYTDANNNDVKDEDETANITVSIEGNGTVTLTDANGTELPQNTDGTYTLLFDSETESTKKVTVTATPTDVVATDGNVGYVVTNPGTVTVVDGDNTIAVKFDTYTLNADNGEITINGYFSKAGEKLDGLKEKVLTAASLSTDGNYTVYMVVGNTNGGTREIDVVTTDYLDIADMLLRMNVGDSQGFVIKDNNTGVSKQVSMTIKDSRVEPTVTHNYAEEGQTSYTMDDIADLAAQVKANIKVSVGETVYNNANVTVNTTGAKLPGEGQSDDVTVKVTVAETADYQGVTDKEITVKVTNKQHYTSLQWTANSNYTMKVYNGETDISDSKLADGTYTVEITPVVDAEQYVAYYVDSSKVNLAGSTVSIVEENADNDTLEAYWQNGNYYFQIKVENNATKDDTATLTVSNAVRKIVLNTRTNGYQVTLTEAIDTVEELEAAIYSEVVNIDASIYAPAANYKITGTPATVAEGSYSIQIEYPGNSVTEKTGEVQYAALKTASVTVTVSKEKQNIALPNVGTITVGTDWETKIPEAVTAAIRSQYAALANAVIQVTLPENPEAPKQGETKTYENVKVTIAATDTTNAFDGTMTVNVIGEVKAPVVNVNTAENGTVTPEKGEVNGNRVPYTFTLTPNDNYYIESLSVAYDSTKANAPIHEKNIVNASTEETTNVVTTWQYAAGYFTTDGKTTVHVFDGTDLDLGVVPTYTFTAKFVDPSITIPENGTMTYYYGMEKDTENLEGKVMGALGENITFAPETLAKAETDILYKARGAATYTYTVTINPADFGIPFIPSQTVDIPIEADELWVKIGTAFDIGTEPTNEDIQKVVDELTEKYSISELINMFGNDQDQLKALIETELKNNQAFVNFYTNYGAHYFGEQEEETVKLVIEKHTQYGDVESNECVLTLTDNRTATSITANPVEITYDFTEEELLEAMGAAVMANGAKVGTPEFVTNVVGLGASEEAYTIKLKYAGSEEYKPSEGETTVTVKKAPVDVFVDNRLLHWEEGLTYTMPVSTDPDGVATIKFIAGLDISGMNYDGGIKGLVGDVQLMLPEGLQTMLEGIGLKDGMSMTLSELKDYLDKLGGLFTGTEYEEMVNVLLNMINSLPTDAADIKVTIGGQLPTNIGVYLVGAVSADGNYETDFGVGAVVIYPNGKRAELDWIVEDDNSIITRSLLAGNPPVYDMGAEVTKVYEGTIEAAQSQVVEIFFGVDVDGNIKLETDQNKLNVGAYTEVAMIANWGNELYYAEPLIRAFVVVAESLNVEFIDENGNVNNERLFTFNNEVQSGMEKLRVTYKNGDKAGAVVTEYNVKYLYAGAQTNGIPYASETAPTHAGAYAITAIVTLRDTDNMVSAAGAAVGALVIEPAQATIDVKNVVTEYTGNAVNIADMITVSSEVENLTPDSTVITAGINTDGSFSENGLSAIEGDVNIDFPAWMDEIIAKIDGLEDGMSVAELVAIIDKVDAAVSEYEIEGYELEIFDRLKKVLAQLPQDAKLTFKDADQLAYSAVGTYLVVGIVTDSDFYPAMDAGALVIYPNVGLGTLEWKNVDKNNIFYLDALTPGYLDAKALFGGVEDTAVDPAEIYIGVDADNWLIHLSTQQPDSVGVYTEIAVLNDTNSNAHYALPIIRPVIIVDGIYDVLFHDEKGQVNHDRLFTYDGTPKEIGKIYVYGYDKGFYKEEVPEEDELKVLYIGTDSTGDGWFREEAPTDAGVYTVVATYTDYENGEIVGGGAGMGTMVIAKADMALDMKDTTVTYDGKGHFVDVTSKAADPDYLTVIVDKEKNTINFILEDDLTIAGGAVKTLLEEALGRKLDGEFNVTEVQQAIREIIDQIEAFEIPEEVKAVYDELPAALQNAIADLKASAYDPVKAKLDEVLALIQTEVPQSGTVIFNGDLPVDVGAYQFYGFALSENYEPEATQGVLTIAPVQVKVTVEDKTKVYGEDDLDLTSTVKYYNHEGNELYGITTDISVELSREAGEAVGAYEITAKATVADSNFSVAEVENGTLTITPATATITVHAKTKVYDEKDPEWTYTVSDLANGDTEDALNIEISREPGEEVGTYAITATASNNNYDIQITNSVLTILEASVNPDPDPEPEIKEKLIFNADDVAEVGLPDNLYVDGKPVAKDENGNYILSGEKILAISYKFHVGVNAYETYPTNMYVWELTFSDLDGDGKKETYVADRIKALDDILLYKGTSIRVNDPKGDGIRFFTQLTMDDRDMLLAGKGLEGTMLEGYTLSSYGTLFGRSEYKTVVKDANGVPQQASVAYGVGYINGAATFVDSIFDRSTGLYTGMLTELPHDFGTLYGDFFSRGYLTLKNAEGEEYHLYNGEIRRSIYYVATQNNCYWSAGSDFDNYIEGLISAVENAGQPYEKIYCKTCGK